MRVFFDSSAFVKRYVSEPGTEAVLAWCDRASEIGLSGIALPEIVSAFCRLRREGKIDDTQYRQLKSLLLADIEDAAICDLTREVLTQSIASLETSVLGGMDAIHMVAPSHSRPTFSFPRISGNSMQQLELGCASTRFETHSGVVTPVGGNQC